MFTGNKTLKYFTYAYIPYIIYVYIVVDMYDRVISNRFSNT